MIEFCDVTITFTDGTAETLCSVTRHALRDGVLHLYNKDGEFAPELHLGSYPLDGIRKWVRSER